MQLKTATKLAKTLAILMAEEYSDAHPGARASALPMGDGFDIVCTGYAHKPCVATLCPRTNDDDEAILWVRVTAGPWEDKVYTSPTKWFDL
jgi:hypothetical protein